eukprot:COSAG02_NODE_4365_length_5447_cov_3.412678_8_plen_120_part_01
MPGRAPVRVERPRAARVADRRLVAGQPPSLDRVSHMPVRCPPFADAKKTHARSWQQMYNLRPRAKKTVRLGVWGPAAKRFFTRCVAQADNQDRDVDLYHWSSAEFAATWRDTLSVLVARG